MDLSESQSIPPLKKETITQALNRRIQITEENLYALRELLAKISSDPYLEDILEKTRHLY